MKPIVKNVSSFLNQHKTTIFTIVACLGVPATAATASIATLRAEKKYDKLLEDVEEPTKLEIAKEIVPEYIPSLLVGGATIGCMVGSNSVHAKREAALTSAYLLSDEALKNYKTKVVETLGERKNEKIEHEVMQDKINESSPKDRSVVDTKKGNTLCFDKITGRYFLSDMEYLRRVQNDANEMLINSGWMSLNDVYYVIGLDEISSSVGDELGWDLNSRGLIDFHFGSALTEDGEPCLTLDFDVTPKYKCYLGDR